MNRHSNAPKVGNGNGQLKQPVLKTGKRSKIFLPPVPRKLY